MDIFGILGIVIGVVLAFEKPREWIISLFRKPKDPIRHDLRIQTQFHVHNNGLPLGEIGKNQSDRSYVLTWSVWNDSKEPIQLERGISIRSARVGVTETSITLPQHNHIPVLLPKCKAEILELELTAKETEHLRHWVKQGDLFGLKDANAMIHWIPVAQYQRFTELLEKVAKEHGLPEEVPLGIPVLLQVRKAPNDSLKPDGPDRPTA